MSVAVTTARLLEESELLVVDLEELPADFAGQLRSTRAVPRVVAVIQAAGVVKPSEEFDDVGVGSCDTREFEPHGADTRPVRRAVDSFPVELELRTDVIRESDRVQLHQVRSAGALQRAAPVTKKESHQT
jgi:hypothetical protein